jgi:hypothetical protein
MAINKDISKGRRSEEVNTFQQHTEDKRQFLVEEV